MVGGAGLGLDLAEELERLAPVRDGQPGRAAAGALGAGRRRAADGGGQARPLQPPQRRRTARWASPSAARHARGRRGRTRSTSRRARGQPTGTARSSRASSSASSTRSDGGRGRRLPMPRSRARRTSGGGASKRELAAAAGRRLRSRSARRRRVRVVIDVAAALGVARGRRAGLQRRAGCWRSAPTPRGGGRWSSAPPAWRASAVAQRGASPARIARGRTRRGRRGSLDEGSGGLALADWPALARDPELAAELRARRPRRPAAPASRRARGAGRRPERAAGSAHVLGWGEDPSRLSLRRSSASWPGAGPLCGRLPGRCATGRRAASSSASRPLRGAVAAGASPGPLARGCGALRPGPGRARRRAAGAVAALHRCSGSYPQRGRAGALAQLRRLQERSRGGPAIPDRGKEQS